MTQWNKRLIGLLAAVLFLGLATTAQAQTEKLFADIDATSKIFQEATDAFWEATEIFQTTVFAYAEGDIPILTKNWAAVKDIRDSADDKLKKQFAPLRGDYLKEMEGRVAFMDALVGDPAKTLGIKGQFTTEDIDKLKKLPDLLKTVVDRDTEAVKMAVALVPQLAPAITEMGQAIAKNPMKAASYKKQIKKLKRGRKMLEEIPPEGGRQLKAADSMTGSLVRFIEDKTE
ncbi:MAG: hypothetical protein ABIK09_00675 [Pseudomonadota bacterium]